MDGTLHAPQRQRQPVRSVPVPERQCVELELQLDGQRLQLQQPGSGARNSPHFSPFTGEFCFTSCPLHPPSILPISSIFTDSAMYFVSSRDFVSQSTISKILSVSVFLIAVRTYGIFSSRTRKLAIARASMSSMNSASTLMPNECRWVFGSIWR